MSKKDITDYLWTDKKRTLFGLPLSFTRYFVTDTKIITQTGFFSVREDEIDMYKVTDKSLKRGFFQRLFGLGTIRILSKDIDTPEKELKNIKNSRKVSELIDACITQQRDKYSIRGRDMYGPGGHIPPEHFDFD